VLLYVKWASRRWGTGNLADDVGVRARAVDIGWGPGTLVACWTSQVVVSLLVLAIGLPQGSNTDGLFEDDGSWAVLAVIAVAAVVVAPVVEELLFRGLILRSFLSRFGKPMAVALQSVMFGVVHLTPAIGLGNVSLVLALSAVGAVLGGAAVLTRRLTASIIAHAILNGVALTIVFFTG
jgi:membrane protease YdiL (CAAX protease family)